VRELTFSTPIFQEQPYYGQFETYVTNTMKNIVSTVGWNNNNNPNDYTDDLIRSVLYTTVYFESPSDIATAQNLYAQFNQGTITLLQSNRKAVYYATVRYGTQADYDSMNVRYTNAVAANNYDETTDTFAGLCAPKDLFLCQKTLNMVNNDNTTDVLQKLNLANVMLQSNPNCRLTAFNFMVDMWNQLLDAVGPAPNNVYGSYVRTIPYNFVPLAASDLEILLLQAFMQSHVDVYGQDFINKEISIANLNLAIIAKNANLSQFFDDYGIGYQ